MLFAACCVEGSRRQRDGYYYYHLILLIIGYYLYSKVYNYDCLTKLQIIDGTLVLEQLENCCLERSSEDAPSRMGSVLMSVKIRLRRRKREVFIAPPLKNVVIEPLPMALSDLLLATRVVIVQVSQVV